MWCIVNSTIAKQSYSYCELYWSWLFSNNNTTQNGLFIPTVIIPYILHWFAKANDLKNQLYTRLFVFWKLCLILFGK